MRHYDRADFRHLNDAERYRDYDYVADDGWIGPNERAPYGYAHDDAPPWSTMGDWETRPFAGEHVVDRERGQGRQYGSDHGLGYGRSYDARDFERTAADEYSRGWAREQRGQHPLRHENEARPGYGREHTVDRSGVDRDYRFREQAAGGDANMRSQHRGTRAPETRDPRQQQAQRGERGHEQSGEQHGGFWNTVMHPRQAVRRVVRGMFAGKGPKNWKRQDERIHDDVCEALAHDHEVDASDIEVTVEKGEVTLTGFVQNRRMKLVAEEMIHDILGVEDVHNRLRVRRDAAGEEPGASTGGSGERTGTMGSNATKSSAGSRR